MKKILLIIGVVLNTFTVHAEITNTDVDEWLNYQYLTTDGDIQAGADNIFYLNLRQDGAARDLQGVITFPEGYVVKKMVAIKTNWVIDEDTEEHVLKLNPITIYDNPNTMKYVISSSSAECCYTATNQQVAKITVSVPSDASSVCNIITTDPDPSMGGASMKVAVTSEYQTAHGLPYNYEVHDVKMTFNVVSTTGVDVIKTSDVKSASPIKKIENGKFVIETVNGKYTASGARVK